MAEGMPYFDLKPQRTPVESCEESLEDIEKQACLLFEEFLRLPHSSNTKSMLKKSSKEAADSPIIQEETGHYNYKQSRGPCECDEADEDDLVTDSEVAEKSSSNVVLPQPEPVPTQNPELTRLAHQMQQAGDALYQQYGDRVDGVQTHLVSYVLSNAGDLTYDRLSREIDNMIGRDRNWTNLIFAYYVGKKVCLLTSDTCSTVKSYFEQYLGRSFSRPMQQAGGIAPFVNSKGH